MKKYRFIATEVWALVVGILLILLAISVIVLSHGHETLYGIIMGPIAIGLAIGGFLALSVIGLGVALVVVWLVNKLMESFPIPVAAVLAAAGIGLIIFFIKESLYKDDPDNPIQRKDWEDHYRTRIPLFYLTTTETAKQKRNGTFKPCSVEVGKEIYKTVEDGRCLLNMPTKRLNLNKLTEEEYGQVVNGRVFVKSVDLDRDAKRYEIMLSVFES